MRTGDPIIPVPVTETLSGLRPTSASVGSLEVILVGVGLPGRSVGWLHLEQLLQVPQVNVTDIVEPWWMGNDADTTGRRLFAEARSSIKALGQIRFHATIDQVSSFTRRNPCLVVIASRASDTPKLFRSAVERGASHIFVEKPCATTLEEIRAMKALADKFGVDVVVGYQKTVSDYVQRAVDFCAARQRQIITVLLEHHNPHSLGDLGSVFRQNREGMLLNQCSHELAVWITHWDLTPEDVIDIQVDRERTTLSTIDGITDFSEISFILTTTQGQRLGLQASRCGGMESRITICEGPDGDEAVFTLTSAEEEAVAIRKQAENPDLVWYQPRFEKDYRRLKQLFIDHISSGASGVPDQLPTLETAIKVIELGESLSPAIRAQACQIENHDKPRPPSDRRVIFTTSDRTVQRIWMAPDLFSPDCRLLIDVLRPPCGRLIICIDDEVWRLYRDRIETWAKAQDVQLSTIVIPGGEQYKTVETWLQAIQKISAINPLRQSEPIVAIGGGAVTDTIGFVASTWRRATPWIRIPTTLLGMVDASVGIKVSVNYQGKNGIGDYYSPLHTFIDPTFLATNDERTFKAAIGELLKVGLIFDRRIFDDLRLNGKQLIQKRFLTPNGQLDPIGERLIERSVAAMITCIGPDLYEQNLSREMDFGHTFSRWLENHERFRLMHGEAVTIDCAFSVLLAEQKEWVSTEEVDLLFDVLRELNLIIHVQGLDVLVYEEAIEQITVHRDGTLRAPLPGPFGKCRWTSCIPKSTLHAAWRRLQKYLEAHPQGVFDPSSSGSDHAFSCSNHGLIVEPLDELPDSLEVLRWGVLGCGNIAQDFAHVMKVAPRSVIQAVAARSGERARQFAEKFGVATWYNGYEGLCEDENVDIIYVATVPEFHREHAEMALASGKHVVIEKPLASTPEDAVAILSAAQASGKFCMEGMWTRFFPATELSRRMAREGHIGEIKHVRADFGFDLAKDEGKESSKWQTGAGMNAGVYPTHSAVMILGIEVDRQSAVGCRPSFGEGLDTEGILFGQYQTGQTALISWGHLTETAEEVDIIGSRGTIRIHSPAHAPTSMTVTVKTGRRRDDDESVQTHRFPLPHVPGELIYPNSEGLYYEIAAVERCIAAGLTECPQLPLLESIQVIKMVSEAVTQICQV